jgi:hypothetical protein
MATPFPTTTPIRFINQQSIPPKYPAQELDGKQRQRIAIQVLSHNGSITELAEHHQTSRKFLYQQASKASDALNQTFSPKQNEEDVLFYIPVTKPWLRQVVLALVLLCHSSFRGVIEFFRDILDTSISLGTIHNIIHESVDNAQQINQNQELFRIRAGTHDELFQTGMPVFTGIDLDSTYCYLLSLETHRDAETWGIHLLYLSDQGLNPDYTVADGGLGLRAGQSIAWPDTPCNGDVFHAIHELTKLVGFLENQAYAAITKRDDLEKKMTKAKRRGKGRSLSKQLTQTRVQEANLISLLDDIRLLLQWLRQDILTINGLEYDTRKSLFDFVMYELKRLEPLKKKKVSKVRRSLENQRDALLGFAILIDRGLQKIEERFQVPISLLRDILDLQNQSPTSQTYWLQTEHLYHNLHDKFFLIQQAVVDLKNHTHRASSMVENFNGRLRNYFFLRRQIGSRYLDLLRFFLNHHPFMRSKHPERVGKTPTQLLMGQPHPHWLELLGFTLFKRINKAT